MIEKHRYSALSLFPAGIIIHGVLLCTNAIFIFLVSQGLSGSAWIVCLCILIVVGAFELYMAVLFSQRLRSRFELDLGPQQLEWSLYRGSRCRASLSLAVESVAQLVISAAAGSKLPRDDAHGSIRCLSNFYPLLYSVSLVERDGTRHLLLESGKRRIASGLLDTLACHYPSVSVVHELDDESRILQPHRQRMLKLKKRVCTVIPIFFGVVTLLSALMAYLCARDYEQNPPHVWHEREALLLHMTQKTSSDSGGGRRGGGGTTTTSYFTLQYSWAEAAQIGKVDTTSNPDSILWRNHEGHQCLTIYVNERDPEDIRLETPSRGFVIAITVFSFTVGSLTILLLVLRVRYKHELEGIEAASS